MFGDGTKALRLHTSTALALIFICFSSHTHIPPSSCLTGCQSWAAIPILGVDRTCLAAVIASINTGVQTVADGCNLHVCRAS